MTTQDGARSAITGFWEWWSAQGAATTAAAVADGSLVDQVDELRGRIAAIHPGLAWELAAGRSAAHVLVVTAEGDPALRATARRWLREAPAPGPVWEYDDARRADVDVLGTQLTLGDDRYDLGLVRVAARRRGPFVDVVVHHPLFEVVPDAMRLQVTMLALDSALGERGTELWVGEIQPSPAAPADAFDLAALARLVAGLEADATDDEGRPVWQVLQGTRRTRAGDVPVLALAQVPLHPLTAPDLDRYVAADLAYAVGEQGLPSPAALADLQELNAALGVVLGPDGRVVAHESAAGRRRLHVYVDGTTTAERAVRDTVGGWPGARHVRVHGEPDPAWSRVRHLRG